MLDALLLCLSVQGMLVWSTNGIESIYSSLPQSLWHNPPSVPTPVALPVCVGHASMVSLFTAKAANVPRVTDILKQGRCTRARQLYAEFPAALPLCAGDAIVARPFT